MGLNLAHTQFMDLKWGSELQIEYAACHRWVQSARRDDDEDHHPNHLSHHTQVLGVNLSFGAFKNSYLTEMCDILNWLKNTLCEM